MNINCKGKLIDISSPKIMGILNVTPDSFYDGDMYNNQKLTRVKTVIEAGTGELVIDIGAYSSRPGDQSKQ